MQRSLDLLSELNVGFKVNLLLVSIGLLPPLAALLLLQQIDSSSFQNALALYIVAFVIIYYPLGRAMEELIVLRQTRRINAYVEEVKAGRRTPHFDLPAEKGNEHDFLRLQRNIFWVVQGLRTREARLQDTLNKLETAQRQVLESIEYASRIQRSFLPSGKDLQQALGDHFLFWLPRDGVGGDAYWVKREGELTWLAVFDCTGHGVPGAFLTLIVNSLFEQRCDEACRHNPALLLSRMNTGLKNALSQHGKAQLSDDGLEGGICCIDCRQQVLHYAGARGILFVANGESVREIRGDRTGVGFVNVPPDQQFANHQVHLQGVSCCYLFTDGITDQVGGARRLPFGRSRLRQWCLDNAALPLERQERDLVALFQDYKGTNVQRDDVTMLGFTAREFAC